jgi:chromosome segregation ATPase
MDVAGKGQPVPVNRRKESKGNMENAIKITRLQLENVKRVKCVNLTPEANGLTVIGGNNGQGKTSVLDGLAYLLGGEKYRPSKLQRDGAMNPAELRVELSNGLVVERKGKNASLTVTDPSGKKHGQALLDSFRDELSINLPKFLNASGKEKAKTLLAILGIGDQLAKLDDEEAKTYEERTIIGREADRKGAYAAELPWHNDAPSAHIAVSELVAQLQAVNSRNAERENRRNANRAKNIEAEQATATALAQVARLENIEKHATAEREKAQAEYVRAVNAAEIARNDRIAQIASGLQREKDTTEAAKTKASELAADALKIQHVEENETTETITEQINNAETVNAKITTNAAKKRALDDARLAADEYSNYTARIESIRARRMALLDGANLPLPGLSVSGGDLTFNGRAWDCMAQSEQIRVAVAIVRRLKPECGFVLMDGLEALDTAQLAELSAWMIGEGMQGISTRVSTGDECTIVIEDGTVKSEEK